MAYAALVSLAQTLDLILNHHQLSVSPQLKNQIVLIDEYVIFLQAFLEDFPDEATSFEERIKMVAHVAEDIIEFLWSEHILRSMASSSKPKFKLQLRRRWKRIRSGYGSKLKNQPRKNYQQSCCDYNDLKKVTDEMESISEIVMEIKNRATANDVARLGGSTAPSSSSNSKVVRIENDAMVGFEDDLMVMKHRLCGGSSKLQAVPIVGMGGIGKTTLARAAYDDPLITDHFHIRGWVTISQDYCVQDIALGLLVSMKVPYVENDSIKEDEVYKNLIGRRYLIVLDDLWSRKAWDDLRIMFPNDYYGSRIIITTRLLDVATYPGCYSPVHEMHLMDGDQSWDLLQHKVFKHGPPVSELVYIGQMIARSCRGLPLAIVVVSGILAVDQTKASWENIAENVKSAISANDDNFYKILSLSYTHLPHHLKPCFLYMAGFPENHEMRVSKLIKLWVAEGFLKPNGYGKSFEETAEECLEDLVKRNLVLVAQRKSNGRIKSFRIHDLMREMCTKKAVEEIFFLHVDKFLAESNIRIQFRRVSVANFDKNFLGNVGSNIRTILSFNQGQRDTMCLLRHCRLLRILDMSETKGLESSMPDQVFELIHLRYTAFNRLNEIPTAITNLYNLQTLILHPTSFLPEAIWSMRRLRHLVFHGPLPPLQEGPTFPLQNLQTLSTAVNSVFSIEVLEMIPNLKKMGITLGDNREIFAQDYELYNLTQLQKLENLKLEIYEYPNEKHVPMVGLAFPWALTKLSLRGAGLCLQDMSILRSLRNLEVLKLRDHTFARDQTWETSEGQFCQLKFLLIDGSDLQHWITDSSHFPRLKCLRLYSCWGLREIPNDIGEIPTLELIEVDDLYASLLDSAKEIKREQRSCGNYGLQVRVLCVIGPPPSSSLLSMSPSPVNMSDDEDLLVDGR